MKPPPLRTAVALLFHLLLLQVSVLGGGMACAPEWLGVLATADGATPAAHAGMHHVAGAHAASDAPAPSHAPHHGDVPTHCAAATGCAAVAVAAPELTVAPVAVVHTSVGAGRVSLPPSTRAAPEPPPPRG